MKTFENVVLTFDTSHNKGLEQMKAELADWGAAGYEIVAVTGGQMHPIIHTVFLKREIENASSQEHAA